MRIRAAKAELEEQARNGINVSKEFRDLQTKASLAGLTGKSLFSDIGRAFTRIFEFAGMYGIIQNVVLETPRMIVQAVRDINAAQIELAKVTTASNIELSDYWDEAAESAKKYGAAINEVINNTADWSRLGYSLNEAKKLSDATTLIQQVGDNMTQESASSLSAANNTFEQSLALITAGNSVVQDPQESVMD